MADYQLAQDSLLGSMLISPAIIGNVAAKLRPEDFSEGLAREAFTAIRGLFLAGRPVDPVTVLHEMGPADQSRQDYLLGILDRTPTAAHYREYLDIVQEQARVREIQGVAVRLIEAGMTLDRARELEGQLAGLMVDRPEVECLSMEQGLLDFYADLERKPQYLQWGIDFLDEGLTAEAADYIVLGGYPSDGKTALALSLAYTQAQTQRVGFFSLETKTSKLFSRIVSAAAKVSNARIKRRTLTPEDYEALAERSDDVRRRQLELIRSSSMTVEDIAAYTRSRRYEVIYIDYLSLIQAPGRSEYDQVTYISKALHRLAQDSGVTVIALSQLSRPETGKVKPPTLASLRSSGQIEQDADIVLFIYREQPGELRSRRILSVAKNKEGKTGLIPLLFDGETQTFKRDLKDAIAKAARPEPEYKQLTFHELPDREPVPWEDEYDHAPGAGRRP